MQIKYFKHHEIDYSAWDEAIANSHNSLVYAYSWYLDIVSPQWEALIVGNYEYVMPLTVKRKYGFPYITQPIICQQLGVFSQKNIRQEIIEKFIQIIPYFSYSINLNYKNQISDLYSCNANYVLYLNKDYDFLFSNYSKNTKKNLLKAQKANIILKSDISASTFLDAYYKEDTDKFVKPPREILKRLLEKGFEKKSIFIYGGFSLDEELICAACFWKTQNRIIYIKSHSSREGKKVASMYLLIDHIIKKYSNQNFIFDFDGSRIESVAYFYQGFGSMNQPYYEIRKHSVVSLLEKIKK